jgi:hypothetical protein
MGLEGAGESSSLQFGQYRKHISKECSEKRSTRNYLTKLDVSRTSLLNARPACLVPICVRREVDLLMEKDRAVALIDANH